MEAIPPSAGRGPSARRLAASFLGLLHGHVALLGEELKEQRSQAVQLSLLAGLCLIFALLLLIGLSALLLILCWDSYRLEAAFGLCGVYGAGLLLCVWRLLNGLRTATVPFSASLEELARDREQLLP
ncbi:MAG: phage holin family protein [Pseudomonas sp.]|uniref:phage holin family protein n=1 Tax=Pseudomonas sp. TaxID=306 RepID=UPI0033922AC7